MIVQVNYIESINRLDFTFQFENTDRTSFYTSDRKLVTSFKKKCYFILPDDFNFQQLHPDRLALAILLCCSPFIGKRLWLPFYVSHQFAQIIMSLRNIQMKYNLKTDDKFVQPLNYKNILSDPNTVPSLCLSMGIDSVAGLLIMPDNTVGVFLDRIIGLNDKDLYRKDCAYHDLSQVSQLRSKQNKIYIVGTNLEYLRKNIGFMIDITVGVPAILLSNHCNFNSVGYGYSVHHYEHYVNGKLNGYCTGDDSKFKYHSWNKIFRAAGLNLNMITMGLTEIGTLKVVLNSQFKDIVAGCIQGCINKPCMSCNKCYRKILLKYYLLKGNMKANPQVYNKLTRQSCHSLPKVLDLDTLKFSHAFMTTNYKGTDPFWLAVRNGLSRYRSKFKYLDKWFTGATTCIDSRTYQGIIDNLDKYNIEVVN